MGLAFKRFLFPLAVLSAFGSGLLIPEAVERLGEAFHTPPEETYSPYITPDPRWISMNVQLNDLATRYSGVVGLYVKDLRRGFEYAYNADQPFPSASLIKIPIMAATFLGVQEGRVSLQQRIRMAWQDKRGGSGQLRRFRPGRSFTVEELLRRMMVDSDNTAAQMLVSYLGFEYLNRAFERFGLRETRIHPEGLTLIDGKVRNENYTTPREMAFFLERIYRRELVSQEASDNMIGIMKSVRFRDRLARYLPREWEFAHKTGLLRQACHDVGIVFSPEGEFLVCVLTGNNLDYRRAKRFIASVGWRTFHFYAGEKGESS